MILKDILQGESVFVGANTLIYHFAADPLFVQHVPILSAVSSDTRLSRFAQRMSFPTWRTAL